MFSAMRWHQQPQLAAASGGVVPPTPPGDTAAPLLDGFLFAVPKSKISRSRKRMKWAHMALKNVKTYECRKCGKTKLPHRYCDTINCDKPHLDEVAVERNAGDAAA